MNSQSYQQAKYAAYALYGMEKEAFGGKAITAFGGKVLGKIKNVFKRTPKQLELNLSPKPNIAKSIPVTKNPNVNAAAYAPAKPVAPPRQLELDLSPRPKPRPNPAAPAAPTAPTNPLSPVKPQTVKPGDLKNIRPVEQSSWWDTFKSMHPTMAKAVPYTNAAALALGAGGLGYAAGNAGYNQQQQQQNRRY